MIHFMGNNETFSQVKPGTYVGINGRSVTAKGSKGHSTEFVIRESVKGIHKKGGYAAMGMRHFSSPGNPDPTDSCYEALYKTTTTLSKRTSS